MDNADVASSAAKVSIGEEIELFVKLIDSLVDTLPTTMDAINEMQLDALDQVREFGKRHMEVKILDNNKAVFKTHFSLDTLKRLKQIMKQIEKAIYADKLILRSFITSLVSPYDAYLGRLIRALFLIQPESLNISEKILTFSQLQTFNSIEDAREFIIEQEVESVLRKSHSEQFDWLEKKFDIKLRQGLEVWPSFIELTERRNLFVHSSGIVSSQYINNCNTNKVVISKDIRVGNQLEATFDYVSMAYEIIFEVGVKLAHVLWRKIKPSDRDKADSNLNSLTYDLLVQERYKLACKILDFATDLKKFSSDERRRIFIINRAQAYKWLGDSEKAKSIISNEDWSATSNKFKLAESVILDDFDRANGLVKKIGSAGEIKKEDYGEWPLFKEYRNSDGFLKTFQEVFGEPFQSLETSELTKQSGEAFQFLMDFSESLELRRNTDIKNYPGGLLEFIKDMNVSAERINLEEDTPPVS